jgi:taurine dioxygenase
VPSLATVLYAIDVPARGGATLFSNGLRAYEALPPDVQRELAGLQALHVYDYEEAPTRRPAQLPAKARQAVHPVLRRHEPTGRVALYVSRLMTWSIVGLPPSRSRELLEYLFDHQERPEFVHAHEWQAGDLAVWDNRCCNHGRSDFDPGERRRLRRITVLGDAPPRGIGPA